ncbi:MAG: GNAT family N-acetyltransferase [Candidatus Eisenbacteria bacterium]|nr:GNAT family N-acetyltransferase [Candidatus Eisenbacteria bacterium]
MRYTESVEDLLPEQLTGFFVGWPSPPPPETHLEILRGSSHVVLAVDEDTESVVGFVTAISDGVLAAYIPLLEVLPAHQGRGIGAELMRRMMEKLKRLYMVDLVCDESRAAFYAGLGMKPAHAMVARRYDRQSGLLRGARDRDNIEDI